jgi:FAD/FMN-containing dehydrogenase/Fe-S oxidoreductase
MTSLVHLRMLGEKPRFEREEREGHTRWSRGVDAAGLAAALRGALRGEVRFDRGSRALYATDGSNYRQVPIGVVLPRDAADVIRTVQLAREFGAPLLSRGGGTSLAGQCCNVAVLMDFSKYMNRVLGIDTGRKLGRIEPGCVLDDLRAAATRHGLNFGPDPATHTRCTLGGMLGNNSCGSHSHLCSHEGLGYRTSDNTHELEILTYDGVRLRVGPTSEEQLNAIIRAGGRRGQIYGDLKRLRDKYAGLIRKRFPKLPRRVSGYNLDELLPEKGFHVARALVGTESTCVMILEATVHLVHNPKVRSLLLLGYPDVFHAGDHVMEVLQFKPTACEGVDKLLFDWEKQRGGHQEALKLLPEGGGWLYVEFGGDTKEEADDAARRCMEALKKRPNAPTMKLFDDPHEEKILWEIREGSLGATAWVPGHKDTWEGWEDSAVPPEKVGQYLREFKKLLDKYNYDTSLYGHLGQGCVHCRIPFDFYTKEGIDAYQRFMDEATRLVLSFGGSLSGEHGDGQSRAQFLPRMFGEEIVEAFREFKRIWDPQWKMNPGKVVDAYSITDNLRLGPDYNPPQPETHFKYPSDQHAFSRAVLRCVGIGACRNHQGQTMCPSYMVTREEEHCTRGRARLLWEMMNGDVVTDGWKSEEVKESLDLCLACKGCKHDCPVNVDMATYKAEFLSHYYEGRLRPRHAFAFGFIHVWAELVHKIPGLATIANWLTRVPGTRAVAKAVAGMEQKRDIPPFAPVRFKDRFRRRPVNNPGRPQVLLFADTFNDHFMPETLMAAVEVLEHAGFRVVVPMEDLCCGRPLYDYGFVPTARRWLEQFMEVMRPHVQAGLPMVVLEPSCAAVFRDELTNLFPTNKDAQRLAKQTYLLSEFLVRHAPNFRMPAVGRKVLLHGHCHHKALMGMTDEKDLLKQSGAEFQEPEDGCCGMAGAFGYEKGSHYDVSIKCGERVLLPAVREAGEDTIIMTDGFSCREQIHQETDRHALHFAEVVHLALHKGPGLADGRGRPEDAIVARRAAAHRAASLRTAAGLLGIAATGFLAFRVLKAARGTPAARRG